MGCSSVGGASSAAYPLATAAAKPKQAVAANVDVQIDILAQLSSGTESDSESDGADETIDVTA
jgi:hypothetical protein